ncbi:MAG: hypothetical protein GXP32_08165 [Kiritimatiellaeota bacterium]|nr:hypothetical protein [Kiritimatiellota bacterium]
MDCSLHISKHIRRETEPLLLNYEIEDLSLNYIAADRGGSLAKQNALVIGAGTVGAGIAERLAGKASTVTLCYHVNRPADYSLNDISLISMNELKNELPSADIVVCATSSPGLVLHHGHTPFFDAEKNVLVVDLASPRDVSPELGKLMDNVKIVDLDDLKHWHRRKSVNMAHVYEICEKTIQEHQWRYEKIKKSFTDGNQRQ